MFCPFYIRFCFSFYILLFIIENELVVNMRNDYSVFLLFVLQMYYLSYNTIVNNLLIFTKLFKSNVSS